MQFTTRTIDYLCCDSDVNWVIKTNKQIKEKYKKLILLASKNLTKKQIEVITLYYYDGMSMTQIAKKLNLSVSTVSRRIARGLETLKKFAEVCEKIGAFR